MKTCSIPDCTKAVQSRGWCSMHYKRWSRSGDTASRRRTPDDRFDEKTEPLLWSGCHIWTAGLVPDGYGRFRLGGRNVPAHRYAWERANGPIPEGMELDHRCHTPSCVNPDHLRPATVSENRAHLNGARRNRKFNLPRGVYRRKTGYIAQVYRHSKPHYLGMYSTVSEASAAAEKARQELFGEFAGKGVAS